MSSDGSQPRYGQNPEPGQQPPFGQDPQHGQPVPPAPQYGQRAQYGQQAPQYGQQVPPAPQYGQHAPQYGQETGQYGQVPRYGAHPGQDAYGQQGYGYAAQGVFGAPTTEKDGQATTSLVLGIIGAIAFWIPLVAIGLGIAATVLGSKAKKAAAEGRATKVGQAKAGFVLGIIAIVLGALAWIGNAALLASEMGL
ncbi:DUF4190 domain-containing protein [Georgenia subflava]|uniref:DUF4190 domain-containing protein n=1 Tax=Georgenia subflava TaxID=1622177 RepID=A0A6N7EPY9_9MICO|nr:DUF4190 domain-containing protein [Georgenia subflava]MPV38957.1 hypothetical protein [Georgenia subflava]